MDTVIGLMTSIDKNIHRHTKPKDEVSSEFIVVNLLPINADVMQKCIVNINYYAKDIKPGAVNALRLKSGETSILALFEKATGTGYMIDYEGQETIQDMGDYHFSNLKFSFKQINS